MGELSILSFRKKHMELQDAVYHLRLSVGAFGGEYKNIVFTKEQLLEYTQLAMSLAVHQVVLLEGEKLDD